MSDESETPTYLESNKPEAERCVELASAAWKAGDLAKAHRMLAKSLKLYPTQQANQLIQQLSQHVKEQQQQQQHNEQNRAQQQREQQQRDQEEQARRQHQQRQQEHFRQQQQQQQQQRESSAYQRPNATSQSTPSKPSPSPSSASSPSPSGAAFTTEQRESALLIIKKKHDYYAIFSVTKTATEQEIKKSYRKLALTFHPDKNKAPEAEEAFKVVNGAFQCLSDPQKRAHYDAYGVEDNTSGRGGGPTRQQYYREDDLSPEDVFNMFFNGGMNSMPNMRRTYTYRRQQRQPQAQAEDGPGALFGQFAHFIPLLLLLLFGLLSAPGGEEQVFGLEKSNQFPVYRSTVHAKVDYYVTHQFSYRYNRDIRALAAVEAQVEAQAFKKVEEECQRQKKAHAKEERRAKEDLKGADLAAKLNSLHAKTLSACDKFQTYQNNAHGAARGA